MKRIYICIFVLNMFLFNNAFTQYWEKVTNIPAPYNSTHFLDVFFLPDGQTGWICGFNGHVLRTTNGGTTWSGTVVPMSNHLESIHFPSAMTGYTSGVEGIWKSTNGGASWFSIKPADTVQYWGCYFVDDNNGMVIGEGCSVPFTQYFWKTTDGGTSWTVKTYNVPNSGLTDLILYSATGLGYATSSGLIWVTMDGGLNWNIYEQDGPNIWQEEITNINGSFLVPYAGTDCSGGSNDGGMRFFDGTTWRSYRTGVEMFGAFMVNEVAGWACGDFGAVYYTSNAGRAWELRNCGIEAAHLDDIWFTDPNNGWAVGTKVYKLAPDKQTVSTTDIDFGTACIPFSDSAIVFLTNFSFFDHGAFLEIIDDIDNVFSIETPSSSNINISPCDSVGIILKFNPTEEKNYTGKLRIIIDGKEVLVNLKGNAYILSAAPSDTVLNFGAVQCGKTVMDTVIWTTKKFGESINNVQVVYGGSNIKYLSTYPATLYSSTPVPSIFSAMPADTGWNEAKFAFKMLPCNLYYNITVKVYGISPIIQAEQNNKFNLNCIKNLTDTIPVYNTGNSDLIISSALLNDYSKGFSVSGWTSKRSLPIIIKPGEADSIVVSYNPKVNTPVKVDLVMNNNDVTTKNGVKSPYKITLTGEVLSVRLEGDTILDFGDVCIGTSKDINYRIKNLGNMASSVSVIETDKSIFSVDLTGLQIPYNLNTNDSLFVKIKFSPSIIGNFTGIIKFYDSSCGDSVVLNVKGKGVSSELDVNPGTLTAVLQTQVDTVSRSVKVKNTGNTSVTINSYSFNPSITGIYNKLLTPLPVILNPGDSAALVFEFSAMLDTVINTNLCLNTTSYCPLNKCTGLELQSHSNWLDIEPDSIDYELIKCPGSYSREFTIINRGKSDENIESIDFKTGGIFNLQNLPAMPYILAAGDSLKFNVNYTTNNEGIFNDTVIVKSVNKQRIKEYYMVVKAEFRTPKISLTTEIADFKIAEFCDTIRSLIIKAYNSGAYGDTLIVSRLNNIVGFEINPPDRIIVPANDSTDITITCTPQDMQTGKYSELFRLQSEICDSVYTIRSDVEIIKPRLEIDPKSLDFGSVWVGESQKKSFTITNNSGFDKWVDSISIGNPNFIHNLPLPELFRDGDLKNVDVKFISPAMGSYPGNITIYERSVCLDSTIINLLAESPEEIYYTELKLDDKTAEPGDTVSLLLHLKHDDRNLQHDLSKLGITGIDYEFKFDNYLFYPLKVYSNNFNNYSEVIANKEFSIISGSLDGTTSTNLFLKSGDIMKIEGIALASMPNSTIIEIAKFKINTPKNIILNKQDGSLTVNGYCLFEASHKLQRNNIDYVQLVSSVVDDKIELISKFATGRKVMVEVYDVIGNLRLKFDFYSKSGFSINEFSIETLGSGSYFINLTDGNNNRWNSHFILLK